MPEFVPYTCTDGICDMNGRTWPVECDGHGKPADEAETRCPECYGPGLRVQRPVHEDVYPDGAVAWPSNY